MFEFLNFKINNKLFVIFILLSVIININNDDLSSLIYPTTYVLLNQNIVLVTSEGIRFFSSNMELYESKYVILKKSIENLEQNGKITISQFPSDYGGYLMVLVSDVIYFFTYDGTLINSTDLSDSINSIYYTLIPYKVEDNYLHYIISYPLINQLSFGFTYYKFNLDSPNENEIVKKKTIKPIIESTSNEQTTNDINDIYGGRCLFMVHPSLNREILVCFYAVRHPAEVQTRSFDPQNDFNEIDEYLKYCLHPNEFEYLTFFDIVTDKQNEVVNIFLASRIPYKLTFDFTNYFV